MLESSRTQAPHQNVASSASRRSSAATDGWLRLPHDTAAALPARLDHFPVFDEHGHHSLAPGQFAHSQESRAIDLHVVFDELLPAPFEPLAHLSRVRTTGGSKKLKHGHAKSIPDSRAS